MHKTVVATSEKTYFVGVRVAPAAFAGAKARDAMAKSEAPITIKKYANRRLYNTGTSSYVTLEDLASMVKRGEDFLVYDAKTGEDITRSVLAQIIFEQENKEGQNLLPVNFLRQLIRFYGDSMQMLVPLSGSSSIRLTASRRSSEHDGAAFVSRFGPLAEHVRGHECSQGLRMLRRLPAWGPPAPAAAAREGCPIISTR